MNATPPLRARSLVCLCRAFANEVPLLLAGLLGLALLPDAVAQEGKTHGSSPSIPQNPGSSGRERRPFFSFFSHPFCPKAPVVDEGCAVELEPGVVLQDPLPRYSDWYYAYADIISSRVPGWAKEIDASSKMVDQWGYASATGLILIEDTPVGRVGFDYDRSFRENYNDAGDVQGSASNLLEVSSSLQVGAGSTSPPPSPAMQIVAFQEVPVLGVDGKPTTQTERVPVYKPAFEKPGMLLPGGIDPQTGERRFQGTLSVDDTQMAAASITVAGRLLEMMAHPTGMPENTRAFLGVTQISVSPGWKTAERYVCEVTVSVNYGSKLNTDDVHVSDLDIAVLGDPEKAKTFIADLDKIKGADPYDYETPPLIYSAFPLAKQQVLDLQHSFRKQTELLALAQVSALQSGNIGAAKAAGNMIRKLQQDVATKSALPVVVPSSNGRFISYRFDPTLYALAQPASAKSKAGIQLKAMSIPALVVIVCNKKDLERFKTIRLQSSTRWIPIQTRDLLIPLRPRRQDTAEIFEGAKGLDRVYREMMEVYRGIQDNLIPAEKKLLLTGFDTTYSSLLSRVSELSQKVATSFLDVPLPEIENTSLKVTPNKISKSQVDYGTVVFTIVGDELSSLAQQEPGKGAPGEGAFAFLGGVPLSARHVDPHTVLCELPPDSALPAGPHDLVILTRAGVRQAPGAVEVLAEPAPAKPQPDTSSPAAQNVEPPHQEPAQQKDAGAGTGGVGRTAKVPASP